MDLVRDALALLGEETTMTLAVRDERGPWAAAVYFVADRFRLYWLSEPDCRHSRAIGADGAVAAEIHACETDWRKLRGLQIEGRAIEVADAAERRRAENLYLERFPFARPLLARLRGVRWYRLDPDRMVSVDNARGFGDRREVPLPARERPR
jgi:uncharacterized protein YhbP (UPF0306 family)